MIKTVLAGLLSVLLLCLAFTLPTVQAQESQGVANSGQVTEPGTELWRAIRQRHAEDAPKPPLDAKTQAQGIDQAMLINQEGEQWRQFRMQQLIPNAAKLLGFVLLAIIVFRLIRGRIPIKAGRSGVSIKRFTSWQRFVHWSVAILFVLLAISGSALLFGRYIIMPYLGAEAGGAIMYVLKRLHDFSGPVFAVMLLLMCISFIKGNFPSLKTDIMWVLKGGGVLGWHAPAGRYNAGEKGWYWIAILLGTVVVISGLVLDFPNYGQERNTMSYYHFIHSISAVVIMAISMGHIYMGTLAMEGAFEAMYSGYCDSNWAKEHHDLWYQELVENGTLEEKNHIPQATTHPQKATLEH